MGDWASKLLRDREMGGNGNSWAAQQLQGRGQNEAPAPLPTSEPGLAHANGPIPEPAVSQAPADDGNMVSRFLAGFGSGGDDYGLNALASSGPPEQATLDTASDTGVGALNGATMNYGDEAAGLLGGDPWRDAVRQRVALAHERSPIGSRVGEGLGGMAATAAIPGGGAAAALARGVAAGGLSASGAAPEGQRLQAGGKGALAGLATAGAPLALGGLMKVGGSAAQGLANYANSGKMADQMQRSAAYTLGSAGMWGNPMHAVGTAVGLGAGSQVLPQMVGAAGGPVAGAMRGFGNGVGSAAKTLAGGTGDVAGGNVGNSMGHKMEERISKLMQTNPEVLGQYQQEMSQAMEKGGLGALIDRLEQTDTNFRTNISPLIKGSR